jgi:glycosyltransferase involved in cell wall biosynthesis
MVCWQQRRDRFLGFDRRIYLGSNKLRGAGYKISILLAVRNGAAFLPKQLESYRAQTYPHWELVASDDGSSDETVRILEEFARSITQRVVILEGPQQGFWQNFVAMVRCTETTGTLFAYSDQDDIWCPEKLQRAADWFESVAPEEPALYFTRTELVSSDELPIGYSRLFKRPPSFKNALVQNIGGGNTMVFNGVARAALLETPRDAELVSHDWWTYQVVSGIGGKLNYDQRPSLKYRQHAQNIFGTNLGWRSRFSRFLGLTSGLVARWNAANLKVLNDTALALTPENKITRDFFANARTSSFPRRLYMLWKSGVYRQTLTETLGLYLGATFGRL